MKIYKENTTLVRAADFLAVVTISERKMNPICLLYHVELEKLKVKEEINIPKVSLFHLRLKVHIVEFPLWHSLQKNLLESHNCKIYSATDNQKLQ